MSSRLGHDFVVRRGEAVCRKCGFHVYPTSRPQDVPPCPFPDDQPHSQIDIDRRMDLDAEILAADRMQVLAKLLKRIDYENEQLLHVERIDWPRRSAYVKGLEKALRIVEGKDEP